DCDNAINKFIRIQPHCPTTEFVIIVVLAIKTTFPTNSNSGVSSVVAIPKM
ncbi:4998_t:CDS:1, partial [Racocetra fulgida]